MVRVFSSPRGRFNVLIYMHRYLREFRVGASSSQREKTAALKEIERLNKTIEEIRAYERDVLYPLAAQGIQIDLDDGVKVNYKKFGKALVKITGLSE